MLQPRVMALLGALGAVMVIVALTGFTFLDFRTGRVVQVEADLPPVVDASQPEHDGFREAYQAKLGNAAYVAYKSQPGVPTERQVFPEEVRIKDVRSRLARNVRVPEGVEPTVIPMIDDPPPVIDGVFGYGEWDQAIRVPIGLNGTKTTLLLMADRRHLYVACDAPSETTEEGYDQFRFYVHIGLTPLLANERVHVGRQSGSLGGIRETRVRWRGEAASGDHERWKQYNISDWQIYEHAAGASAIDEHRRYEAVLELFETGLTVGVPFTARVEVESDPTRNGAGRVTGRTMIGELGRQTTPVWFVIEDR
jgi:hypothetical protein